MQGIPGVIAYLDILVSGVAEEEHLKLNIGTFEHLNDDSDTLTEMPSVETSAEISPEIADTEGTSSNNQHGENSSTDAATSTSTSLMSATPRYPQ